VPVFSIRSPQGVVIHIQAPDQQTALQGAQQWASQNAGYLAARANAQQNIAQQNNVSGPKALGGAINSAAHAATFGGLSDIGGAVNAARDGMQNFAADHLGLGKNTGYGMGDAYKGYVDADRDAAQQYGQQHPSVNLGAQILGGSVAPGAVQGMKYIQAAPVVTAAEAGGRFLAGARNVAATAGRSAAVGAGMGAAAGFGNASGTPTQRLAPTAQGAVTGAITGAAVPAALAAAKPVIGAVGDAASNLGTNLGRRVGAIAPEVTANQQLAKALMADGQTSGSLVQGAQNFPGASTPTIADIAGENTRAAVRNAATQGPARNVAQGYRDGVAANLQENAINLTNNLTPGEVRTPAQLQTALRNQQLAAAGAQYPAFKAIPVPMNQQLASALSGKSGGGAIGYAAKLADALRDNDAATELAAISNGTSPDTVSAGALDTIRRGLRDSADKAVQAGDNGIAFGLGGRADDVQGALSTIPEWETANNTFKNYAQQIDAVDHGSTGLTARPPNFAAGIQPMTPEAQAASGVGYRQALVNALGAPTENAVGALNKIATSTNQGQNLAAQYGQDAADAYRAGLGAEADRMTNANYMAPNSNSATAGRQADAHSFSIHGAMDALKGLLNGPDLTDAERQVMVQGGLAQSPDDALMAALMKIQNPGPGITALGPYAVPVAAQQSVLQGPN
jgi:hypothetical protein